MWASARAGFFNAPFFGGNLGSVISFHANIVAGIRAGAINCAADVSGGIATRSGFRER